MIANNQQHMLNVTKHIYSIQKFFLTAITNLLMPQLNQYNIVKTISI